MARSAATGKRLQSDRVRTDLGDQLQQACKEGALRNERESILTSLRQQVRDIRQGPDGLIYVVTRQDANQTPNSGKILRIEPAD